MGFVNSIVSLRWVWENEDCILKMVFENSIVYISKMSLGEWGLYLEDGICKLNCIFKMSLGEWGLYLEDGIWKLNCIFKMSLGEWGLYLEDGIEEVNCILKMGLVKDCTFKMGLRKRIVSWGWDLEEDRTSKRDWN